MEISWTGVLPAITTKFNADDSIDHTFFAEHCHWLVNAGCTGLVPLGSLGEGATLSFAEKISLLETAIKAVGEQVPIIPGIASLSTTEAINLAQAAEQAGCSGLMVLPPYVYSTDWREMKAHVTAVLRATSLSCMLYNNPISTKPTFYQSRLPNLQKNIRTWWRLKSLAPTYAAFAPSERC